ncbi:TRAP transporter large permease [Oceanibacterium hippocampi]|uniref:TRAP transporter large permease protein n=1 Tax=Oceanibacterium hippocampi TaxID=745714 RepID=A0A1Y5TY40_9PROT|nr:TRAP transporter large permease [Oceanibacterium hippocampi]SLN76325.1 Sialic acid TRAP transporter permease protein SiaT [Oceanibacterium hippocampi]
MSGLEIGLCSLAAMLILIWLGMHVAVALTLLSFLGVWAIKGNWVVASKLLALAAYDSIASHIFGVVPLFVLMGLLVSVSDIGKDTFEIAHRMFHRVRGGLGIATVAANAVFAAITGISIASAAVFTKVAVPEMLRLGYTPRFATGVVAGSSVLGMLIPPSLLLILYGFLAETSVGALFIAGIVPGLVLACAFAVLIVFLAHRVPSFVGGDEGRSVSANGEGNDAGALSLAIILAKLGPIVLLIGLVLGGIYGGFFTPTEAGAVGALGALLLALAKRKLSLRGFWQVLVETGHVTVSISFLIIAASIYTRMLTLSGIPQFVIGGIEGAELGFAAVLAIYVVIVLLMGTVLDSTSIMLVSLPLILPVMIGFNADLVWFGIVTVLAVEIGLLTPPLGIAVYVIASTLDDPRIKLGDIFIGAAPFAAIMLLVLIAVILWPPLSIALVY